MKRHAYMLDLLRPEMTFDSVLENMTVRAELTVEDLDTIIENAQGIVNAAKITRARRRT